MHVRDQAPPLIHCVVFLDKPYNLLSKCLSLSRSTKWVSGPSRFGPPVIGISYDINVNRELTFAKKTKFLLDSGTLSSCW